MNRRQNRSVPSECELESLLVNNADLGQISAYLNRFNPIRVMRMERMEIRHSAILSWLLDPMENHGLNDSFLRAFLAQALRGEEGQKISALEVYQADLRDIQVQREKRNIDIFILSPKNGWGFIIENKFDSTQGHDQLLRYRLRAEQDSKQEGRELVIQGVFLTLHGEPPNRNVAGYYASIWYGDIVNILSSLLLLNREVISGEVKNFIEQYMDVIRKSAGMDEQYSKMVNLAKEIYRNHKKAIDFIAEHGLSNEFSIACDNVFGSDLKYGEIRSVGGSDFTVMYNSQNRRTISFLPQKWFEAFGGKEHQSLEGCENWWAGFPMICWIGINSDDDGVGGELRLYAEVGPISNPDIRNQLIDRISEWGSEHAQSVIQFSNQAKNPDKKFSRFLKKEKSTVRIQDIDDAQAIENGMEEIIRRFGPVLDGLAEPLGRVNQEVMAQG